MDPQQQNNGFGPLPQRRGESAKAFATLLALVPAIACVMAVFIAQDKGVIKEYIFISIYGIGRLMLSFIIGKVIQKICQLWEERRHRHTRYNGNWKKVLRSTFAFRSGDAVFSFVTVFLLALSYALQLESTTFSHLDYQFWILCLNSCWVALLFFAVGCQEPSIAEVSRINERENKNVADGLAWGYYFAYLKSVLPKLAEQIGTSEEYRYKISRKKLYILIPKDCNTFKRMEDADSRIKADGNLNPYEVYRAGTRRVYKLAVHSIQFAGEEEPYYLVMEYATTLMTLNEMSRNPEAGLSRQQRDEQVLFLILLVLVQLTLCKIIIHDFSIYFRQST